MTSITQTCKVEGCDGVGDLKKRNGKRYLKKGYCAKHYSRLQNGNDIESNTIFDKRPAIIEGNIAKIPIGLNAKDGYAIVDKDFSWLDQYKWCLSAGYAGSLDKNSRIGIRMHNVIMGRLQIGLEVDHKNHNRLDNRLENLRVVTRQQNMMNSIKPSNNTSGYKGVSWHKQRSKWTARAKIDGIYKSLGLFETPQEAALAYNIATVKYHGEYACINKIN